MKLDNYTVTESNCQNLSKKKVYVNELMKILLALEKWDLELRSANNLFQGLDRKYFRLSGSRSKGKIK